MVIRFDENRLKDIVNREPMGVDGDAHVRNGMSESDMILENARKSMAVSGVVEDPESHVEEARKKMVQKMVEEEPGPELVLDEKGSSKEDVEEKDK